MIHATPEINIGIATVFLRPILGKIEGVCTGTARVVGNAEFGIDLRSIHRIIPILVHHFAREISACFLFVCTSPARVPLSIPALGGRLT